MEPRQMPSFVAGWASTRLCRKGLISVSAMSYQWRFAFLTEGEFHKHEGGVKYIVCSH